MVDAEFPEGVGVVLMIKAYGGNQSLFLRLWLAMLSAVNLLLVISRALYPPQKTGFHQEKNLLPPTSFLTSHHLNTSYFFFSTHHRPQLLYMLKCSSAHHTKIAHCAPHLPHGWDQLPWCPGLRAADCLA